MAKNNSDILHLEKPDDASRFLGQLAEDVIDQLQSIAHDEDDATKLDRATAIVRKAPPQVMALVALGLFATVREYEEAIEASNSLLRKLVAGAVNDAGA
jgi:hypothetical protein